MTLLRVHLLCCASTTHNNLNQNALLWTQRGFCHKTWQYTERSVWVGQSYSEKSASPRQLMGLFYSTYFYRMTVVTFIKLFKIVWWSSLESLGSCYYSEQPESEASLDRASSLTDEYQWIRTDISKVARWRPTKYLSKISNTSQIVT